MITTDEAARLLTAEAEQTMALLGGRLLGGALRVAELRLAVGQTGEVAPDESFLLSPAGEGRPGWAVEVRLEAEHAPLAEVVTQPRLPSAVPLAVLADRDCTVLRGVDTDTAAALRELGAVDVGALARLPESRLGDLVAGAHGLRLVDAWSRAQLLQLPLPPVDLSALRDLELSRLVAVTPARLRVLGVPGDVPDHVLEELARVLTLLGAALDVRVLRTVRLGDLVAAEVR